MLPILQIGPLALPVPQFSILLAFWLGISLAEKQAPRHGISADGLYNLVFTGLVAGLIGARIGYVFQNLSAFIQSPLSLFSLNPGLLDVFSGIAIALLGMFIHGQRKKISFWHAVDALTPLLAVLAIGIAFAHIASGESFGSETNLPWGINLWGVKRHPSQFYELITAITIFSLITFSPKFNYKTGTTFLVFLALSATARLFLEAFQGDSLTILNGFRVPQIIGWSVLAIVLPILDIINRKATES
ncbi:MAG: prolipoprotein diacylglyceryl transferase [Chloroflexi bacterium]|nr:prolipoprotein diacylglyceryl transferase [Chloroflexota bacterium]